MNTRENTKKLMQKPEDEEIVFVPKKIDPVVWQDYKERGFISRQIGPEVLQDQDFKDAIEEGIIIERFRIWAPILTQYKLDKIETLRKELILKQEEINELETNIKIKFDKIGILEAENKNLQELLNKKYPASSLLRICLALFFISSVTIIAWYGLNLPIIHPMLSLPIFVASLGFSILSFLRIKWARS